MARQILPIVGAATGYAIAGPVGAQAGFVAGSILGNAIDPLDPASNKIGDAPAQTAEEGGPRAITYGTTQITATQVLARGNRVIKKKKAGGGGKGSKKQKVKHVYWTFAIGLGEQLVGKTITRIWQDENVVYDVRPDSLKSGKDNAAFASGFTFYNGSESQLPDPDLQVFLGDDTPYFRGTAYVVFKQFDLTSQNERIPQFKFEVSSGWQQTPTLITATTCNLNWLQSSVHTGGGGDAAGMGLEFLDNAGAVISSVFSTIIVTPEFAWTPRSLSAAIPAGCYRVRVIMRMARLQGINNDGYIRQIAMDFDGAPKSIFNSSGELGTTQGWTAYGGYGGIGLYYAWWGVPTYFFMGADNANAAAAQVWPYNSGTPVTLGDIVSDVCSKVGIGTALRDTSALTDIVCGLTLEESANAVDIIASCLAPYFADGVEYDGKLRFKKRGGTNVRTLTYDDLVDYPDSSQRQNQIEYPAKLHFFYKSVAAGYEQTKATSSRNQTGTEASTTVPIVFYDANAPTIIAKILHKVALVEAGGTFEWKVSRANIDLVPTDNLQLSLRGVVTNVRITAVEHDTDAITLTMTKNESGVYTYIPPPPGSDGDPIAPTPTPTLPSPTVESDSVLYVLDIPALLDTHDFLGYYVAVCGQTNNWTGAEVEMSVDGGANWTSVDAVEQNTIMGTLTAILPSGTAGTIDSTSTLSVQLYDHDDELISYASADWMAKAGMCAVGYSDGTWELLQYETATLVSSGLYDLTNLRRGRLQTSAAAHAVGDKFVFFDENMHVYSAQTTWLATSLKFRATSVGLTPEGDTIQTLTYAGAMQKEFPVASFTATFDTKIVRITAIVPLYRFGTDAAPIKSTNWSGYRIICTGATGTITVNTTDTFATIDCTTIGAVSAVSVAQLNRITGAGPAVSVAPTSISYTAPYWVVNGGGNP